MTKKNSNTVWFGGTAKYIFATVLVVHQWGPFEGCDVGAEFRCPTGQTRACVCARRVNGTVVSWVHAADLSVVILSLEEKSIKQTWSPIVALLRIGTEKSGASFGHKYGRKDIHIRVHTSTLAAGTVVSFLK